MLRIMNLQSVLLLIGVLFLNCSSSDQSVEAETPNETEDVVLDELKVMAYNIHHANPPSKPDVIDIEAIVRVIKNQDPDLVALQEVDSHTKRSGEGNQAELIAEQLGMYYYFSKAINYDDGEYGNAILSRYPIENVETINLPNEPGSNVENRVLSKGEIVLSSGTRVVFASTHLDYKANSPSRILQIEKIIEIAKDLEMPMILAGDFNDVMGSETLNLLRSEFDLSCRTCPPTIPVVQPTRAIDFISYRHPDGKFRAKDHEVINETYASDHRPIAATIELLE